MIAYPYLFSISCSSLADFL